MLSFDAADRPSVKKIQNTLREIKEGHFMEKISVGTRPYSALRGRGIVDRTKPKAPATPITPSATPKTPKAKVELRGTGLNNADK